MPTSLPPSPSPPTPATGSRFALPVFFFFFFFFFLTAGQIPRDGLCLITAQSDFLVEALDLQDAADSGLPAHLEQLAN